MKAAACLLTLLITAQLFIPALPAIIERLSQ